MSSMSPLRRLAPAVLAVTTVAVLSAAIYRRTQKSDDAEPAREKAPAALVQTSASGTFATDVAIPVQGSKAVRGDLVMSVSAAGQAEAWQKTVLVAQVTGRVTSLPIREGDAVRAGQPVAGLDGAEYALNVEEAQAALTEAQGKFREATLLDDQITDAQVRADRQAAARSRSGVEAAEVRVRRARLDLSRTRMAAPFAGRVASLKAVPGQWVRQGDELMTLVSLDPIRVQVQVLESELAHLAPGHTATVSFAAFPGEAFTGRIQTLNPIVESGTRTARVTVLVPNPGGRILPGMYARVSLQARRFANRVLVPRAALLERDRRTMLFVFDGAGGSGQAKWRYVTTGLQNDSVVEIVSGMDTDSVAPGETVLVDGHYTLIHDARVRLVDDVRSAGGRPD
ncbi:efflux RND transporter periplasmic adaptor subunit [Longimicrobium terrae]|uniref:HlyD family secretion protein n=1 Tax=Longimicrobium terrae TaxID=1639882 RepID=A0A841H6U6_9BACT|nr:efflux RND transporter periplasmic adaptor subunit [Longimicrobium terrae]MBB6073673.1 HlyD family secretion protein [Longimicrobium terrae]NNC30351.1 efflux RND transporter periplasmic adaptor subunit [Longimicrobium terrae]